jgi:hypothetical protein
VQTLQVDISELQPGWVIRSAHFANGYPMPDEDGKRIIYIEPSPTPKESHDPARAQALFAVLKLETWQCDHTPGCCFAIDVVARRLKPDGASDPQGEVIRFGVLVGFPSPLDHLELIGQMSSDGSTVTYTLPKNFP